MFRKLISDVESIRIYHPIYLFVAPTKTFSASDDSVISAEAKKCIARRYSPGEIRRARMKCGSRSSSYSNAIILGAA